MNVVVIRPCKRRAISGQKAPAAEGKQFGAPVPSGRHTCNFTKRCRITFVAIRGQFQISQLIPCYGH